MTDFEKVLMKRDGLTEEEARKARNEAEDMVYEILNSGGGYDEVEDMMCCEYGLEMDYITDIL